MKNTRVALSWAAPAVLFALLLVACGDGDPGLSRAEVGEIVRAELSGVPTPEPAPTPGLTQADVEDAISSALGALPEPGLTGDEVERIVVAAIESMPAPEPGVRAAEVRRAISTAIESIPDPEPGLTRDDVEQIVAAAMESVPEPGLTGDEVEQIVVAAIESIPEPQTGLSAVEVAAAIRTAIDAIPEPASALTRDDVDEIVGAAIGEIPEPGVTSGQMNRAIRTAIDAIPEPDSGLSRGDVRRIVNSAIGDIPEPDPGLTSDEAELIASLAVASIPPRAAEADYTRFFVNNAITRYRALGLDATLDYYNRPESIDGQWYVFIIDGDDTVIGHPDSGRLGLDLNGWVGYDANGYRFGPEMLSATEDGRWVSYVYSNPERGSLSPEGLSDVELKNAWVVRHDDLLFASGWYINVDEFTQDIVSAVVQLFGSVGLEGVIEAVTNNPASILGGVASSAVSYNTSGAIEGEWSVFIADENGTIVLHFNPARIGQRLEDLLGTGTSDIDEDGIWLTSESMRVWAVEYDGWVFGAGWHQGQ